MYKIFKIYESEEVAFIKLLETGACIPIAPDNSDYQQFKLQINSDQAQLEDADGNVMSPEAAKAFVATLP